MIIRRQYMEQIWDFIDKPVVKVITGMRRCGKSVILKQIQNELLRRGYQVTVGKQNAAEIDFIANKTDERIYIQVCYLLTEENMEREFGPLERISDNYEKVVLSMDALISFDRGGIRRKNIVEYLLGR